MKEINSIDELKSIELDIMKKVHNLCEKYRIDYCLSFGTLIGAVRHKGFIPWDDDIDIYMSRTNYQKFLKIPVEEFKSLYLCLANHKTPVYYGRCFTKVFDTRTVLIEPQYKTDAPIGVFIDIWPLDGLPNTHVNKIFVRFYAFILKKLILAASMADNQNYSFAKRCIVKIAGIFNSKKLVIKMDKLARKYGYEGSEEVFCYAGQDAVYKKWYFDKRILMRFEDANFYVPAEYDRILTLEFGDYMLLPPKEQQIPHHVIKAYYKM